MAKEAFGERQAQDLKLELFKKVHLFEDLSTEELKDALKYMQLRTFRRNEYLFFEEEAEPGVYILIDGLIKLLKETHDARIVKVRLVYPRRCVRLDRVWQKGTKKHLHCKSHGR